MKAIEVEKSGISQSACIPYCNRQRQLAFEKIKSIPDDENRVLIATGRYIGEGFDASRLDTLFLTMPIFWRGTLVQYADRLHRLHYAKQEVVIYDYIDKKVQMLLNMSEKRMKGYHSLGYEIEPSTLSLFQ